MNAASPREPRPRRHIARRLLAIVLTAYLAWCVAVLLLQDSLLFPRWTTGEPAGNPPRHAERLWITSPGGHAVEALYFPAERRPGDGPGPHAAIIYAHGNGELVHHCTDIARLYTAMGFAVLIPEYRGYGNADGAPSQRAIVSDLVRFYDVLAARPEVDPDAIILHGRSLGGGVATQIAAQRRPAALILESTFTSVASFAWGLGVPPFLTRHPFRTDRVLPTLSDLPILIMHGRADSTIPVVHAHRLCKLAPHAIYYETSDDHNTFPSDAAAYSQALREFLTDHGLLPVP